MPTSEPNPAKLDGALLDGVLARDFRSIARLITRIEDGDPGATAYLRELFLRTGRCATVGVTGAPGSGKSTLVNGLSTYFRKRGDLLGIIAVDPSSPFSGGAILGDRIRMHSLRDDPATFVRSLATRGHLGGLTQATSDVLHVLDAAGFEVVLIETVGVGQDEVEIVRIARMTLVLLVPGMGDEIQAMKAGIMEIGDVFVLNKSDRPGADRMEKELASLLDGSTRPDGWRPPVIRTVATREQGIEECGRAIDRYLRFQQSSGTQKDRALRRWREHLLDLIRAECARRLLADRKSCERLDEMTRKVDAREMDPYTAVDEIMRSSVCINRPEEE